MGGGHGIGITRNDWRRRNRKEKPGRSHFYAPRNGPAFGNAVTREIEEIKVVKLHQRELVKLAKKHWDTRKHEGKNEVTIELQCFTYVRHKLTDYDKLTRRTHKNPDDPDSNYLYIVQKVCSAIAEAYPWLRRMALIYYRSKANLPRWHKVRVIKRPKTLTQEQLEEQNAREEEKWQGILAALKQEEMANDEMEINLTEALSSLASERLLYFPPFLKKEEIKRRRFYSGLENNDRWWEWEKELGLKTTEKRPDEHIK